MKKIYKIDGNNFTTIEEFYDEITSALIPNMKWGKNLNAFNDILRGGFGTPKEGFILIWNNADVSRKNLGTTIFDDILEIIYSHCPGGYEEQSGVELILI